MKQHLTTLLVVATGLTANAAVVQTVDGPVTAISTGPSSVGIINTSNDTGDWLGDLAAGGTYYFGYDVTVDSRYATSDTAENVGGFFYFVEFNGGTGWVGNSWVGTEIGFDLGNKTGSFYTVGETERYVVRIDVTGDANNDTVSLFLNPTSGAEPLTADAIQDTKNGFEGMTGIQLRVGSTNDPNNQVTVENFIVATDFASAAALPVPEPGSLALLGLGGLCVLRRRRA